MNSKLRVAIIGSGQIARLGHIPGYQKAGAEITAICDVTETSVKQVSETFGIGRYYTDWKQMLTDGGFEAVSICTPSAFHCAMAVESARRGYHVLCEKPMATNLAECDQMIAAAQENHILLMISHNQRYMPAHRVAKEILQSGELGKPYLVQTVFGHSGPEKWSPTGQWYFSPVLAKIGVLADLGYHKLDLVQWLLGQDIVEIGAASGTFEKDTPLEDTFAGILKFRSGAIGTVVASWVYKPDMENSVTVRCEKGVLIVPADDGCSVIVRKILDLGKTEEVIHKITSDDHAGWFGAVGAFVEAVNGGLPSPISGKEAKRVMSVILTGYEAISSKQIKTIVD